MISTGKTTLLIVVLALLLPALFLSARPAGAEIVYEYNFEAGWDDWWADNGVWQVGEPTSGPVEAHSPPNCAATNLDGNYGANTDSRLISPSVLLPEVSGDEEIFLRFWHWFSYSTYDAGYVQISVFDGNASEWSDWANISNSIVNTSPWSLMGVDLTDYAGAKVRIAFYHVANSPNNSTGWYIDDIEIPGVPLCSYTLHFGIENDEDVFPQETGDQPYYTGSASGLMTLKYLDTEYPENQDYLYNNYHLGALGEEMNQAEMRDAMNGEAPWEYSFSVLEDNEQDMAIKRFIHWMDYQVPGVARPNVPALVPTDGDYNWKVVRGFKTDMDPCDQDDVFNIPDFLFCGLWLNDPSPSFLLTVS